ncbi:Flp family type IVb pilin [Gilliamella sp. BG2]|uniref:Flp family type IVb pilin n=1 Tax=Gilliamella sp. BG2 TaxID=3351509 RepID=UPI0039860AB8
MMYLSAIRAQARNFLGKFVKNEQGVTAIEYAIVAAGVATVVFVVFKGDGPVATMLSEVFDSLKEKVTGTINATQTPTAP